MGDDDTGLVEGVIRYGSILLPTFDAAPSSVTDSAIFNPALRTVTFVFKRGGSATYGCDIGEWAEYKMSGSRGAAYNNMFRNG